MLASYREYAAALAGITDNPVAKPHDAVIPLYYTLYTAKFISLGETGKTWNDINIDDYPNEDKEDNHERKQGARPHLGCMLLELRRDVSRPRRLCQEWRKAGADGAEGDRLASVIQPLITATGMAEDQLFQSYITPEGKGLGPVVVVYEHQYLEYQVEHLRNTERLDTNRVLLYPAQEFQTDPEFISLKESGDRLAELLATDPELRERMVQLGYRVVGNTDTTGTNQLFDYLKGQKVPTPAERIDFTRAELPELDLLERLIRTAGRCQQ